MLCPPGCGGLQGSARARLRCGINRLTRSGTRPGGLRVGLFWCGPEHGRIARRGQWLAGTGTGKTAMIETAFDSVRVPSRCRARAEVARRANEAGAHRGRRRPAAPGGGRPSRTPTRTPGPPLARSEDSDTQADARGILSTRESQLVGAGPGLGVTGETSESVGRGPPTLMIIAGQPRPRTCTVADSVVPAPRGPGGSYRGRRNVTQAPTDSEKTSSENLEKLETWGTVTAWRLVRRLLRRNIVIDSEDAWRRRAARRRRPGPGRQRRVPVTVTHSRWQACQVTELPPGAARRVRPAGTGNPSARGGPEPALSLAAARTRTRTSQSQPGSLARARRWHRQVHRDGAAGLAVLRGSA